MNLTGIRAKSSYAKAWALINYSKTNNFIGIRGFTLGSIQSSMGRHVRIDAPSTVC